jgi:hypothetical protein
MNDFSPKRHGETELFTVDFSSRLAPGVTIASASWQILAVDGEDPDAVSMIQGDAIINGAHVSQMITAGVPGLRYAPACVAQTSDGQTLIEPPFGQGQLEITL